MFEYEWRYYFRFKFWISGGLGVAPACNLGREYAIFEAVHGTAPDIAGQDLANPSSMILTAVMLCRHLDYFKEADAIEQALKVTLASGCLTGDLTSADRAVTTSVFTDTLISNLGRTMPEYVEREYQPFVMPKLQSRLSVTSDLATVNGVDIYVESNVSLDDLVQSMRSLSEAVALDLHGIYNRGTKVYPADISLTEYIHHWQCRFNPKRGSSSISDDDIREVLRVIESVENISWMHIEKILDL